MTEITTWLDALIVTANFIFVFLVSPIVVFILLFVVTIILGSLAVGAVDGGYRKASVVLWVLCIVVAYLAISTLVFLSSYGGDGLSWTP